MNVEMWPIENIKVRHGGLRRDHHDGDHSAPAIDALVESIRAFGFRQPLVLDAEGVVLSGEARLLAARRLGMREVPVHVARDLSPEGCRAYRIADRAVGDLRGEAPSDWEAWDRDALAAELEGLSEASLAALDRICGAVQSILDGPSPTFGSCPECGGGSMCHVERAEWGYCDEHRVRWFAGANIIGSWRSQSEEHWRSNWERIGPYREVEGVFPTEESEAARRLVRRPWLTAGAAPSPGASGGECGQGPR